MLGMQQQIGERKHACWIESAENMLCRIVLLTAAGSTILKTYDSKSESTHKKYENWVMQLTIFMQIDIDGNEIQFFIDHDPSVTGF